MAEASGRLNPFKNKRLRVCELMTFLLCRSFFVFFDCRKTQFLCFTLIEMRILVTGSTGFIGSHLVKYLRSRKHDVKCLVRKEPKKDSEIFWNIDKKEIDKASVENFSPEAIIHLSGESIMGLWTKEKKKRILESRENTTRFLIESLSSLKTSPSCFMHASGVGFYGNSSEQVLTERSGPGFGFLAEVSKASELAASEAKYKLRSCRVVHGRFGIVMDKSGGMLGAMWLPFKLGVGGVLGNGNCIIFNARKKNKEIFPKLEIQEINIYLGYLLVIFVEHLSTF